MEGREFHSFSNMPAHHPAMKDRAAIYPAKAMSTSSCGFRFIENSWVIVDLGAVQTENVAHFVLLLVPVDEDRRVSRLELRAIADWGKFLRASMSRK